MTLKVRKILRTMFWQIAKVKFIFSSIRLNYITEFNCWRGST